MSLDRVFTDDEMQVLVAWCESVEHATQEHAVPGRAVARRNHSAGATCGVFVSDCQPALTCGVA